MSQIARVSIIGSGNWGTALARIIGHNVLRHSSRFEEQVNMYVYPEEFEGGDLAAYINTHNENKKYLPGAKLSKNVHATADLKKCTDADILIFVLPHQFVANICRQMKDHPRPAGARGISAVKGFLTNESSGQTLPLGIELVSQYISRELSIPMSVLSGANVASEIAIEKFAEATIGFSDDTPRETATLFQMLLHQPYFRVGAIADVAGVETQGAIKNIIALAAGFVDGLEMGSNTKAAIIRIGMKEMHKFARLLSDGVVENSFWESCGLADVITTCYAGRNRKCAEEFARTGDPWNVIEKRMLKGQQLQGTLTSQEVHEFLLKKGLTAEFPFFEQVYKIAFEEASPRSIVNMWMEADKLVPITEAPLLEPHTKPKL